MTAIRLVLNTGIRMVYPFLPELARGVDRTPAAVSRLLALRSAVGLIGPAFGPISDRVGRRPVLLAAVAVFVAGCGVIVVQPSYWTLGAGLILISIAKVIFDPALQGLMGDLVPYGNRGRAMAITETAWAGALLLGAPAAGWLIARGVDADVRALPGWTLPFLAMGTLALLGIVVVYRAAPPPADDRTPGSTRDARKDEESQPSPWALVTGHPAVRSALIFVTLVMWSNELVFIVFGTWMEQRFGLALTGLGLSAVVLGGGELLGEGCVGWAVDRFGKLRLVYLSAGIAALAYAALPFADRALPLTLGALFIAFMSFEMAYVGSLPVLVELAPAGRGAVMSLSMAAMAVGRGIGALVGPPIWRLGGLTAVAGCASCGMLVAIVALRRNVREPTGGEAVATVGDGGSTGV